MRANTVRACNNPTKNKKSPCAPNGAQGDFYVRCLFFDLFKLVGADAAQRAFKILGQFITLIDIAANGANIFCHGFFLLLKNSTVGYQ